MQNTNARLTDAPTRTRIEQLLERYPMISSEEKHEIVTFLREGSIIEVGLLSGNAAMETKLQAFRKDQKKHLSLGPREYLWIATILAVVVILAILAWDTGVTG